MENGSRGTGFFCIIPYKGTNLNVMITNYHCLNEDYLMENNKITFELYGEINRIDINDDRKIYSNEKDDITIIEIKPSKDRIYDFLEIDEEIFGINNKEYFYYNRDIYLLQYCKLDLKFKNYVSYGKIKEFDEERNSLIHYCSTEKGASGSPILNIKNNKLLGIHQWGSSHYSSGKCLKNPIIDFNKDNNLIKKIKNIKITIFLI